jgi:hypothetical protein
MMIGGATLVEEQGLSLLLCCCLLLLLLLLPPDRAITTAANVPPLWQSLQRSMAHLLSCSGTPKRGRGKEVEEDWLAYSCRSGTTRKQALPRD